MDGFPTGHRGVAAKMWRGRTERVLFWSCIIIISAVVFAVGQKRLPAAKRSFREP